jgi:hypothetical protein
VVGIDFGHAHVSVAVAAGFAALVTVEVDGAATRSCTTEGSAPQD